MTQELLPYRFTARSGATLSGFTGPSEKWVKSLMVVMRDHKAPKVIKRSKMSQKALKMEQQLVS